MDKVLNIMEILNDIEYGFKDENGVNLAYTDKWDNFFEFYYLMTPDEVLDKKCGVCWDQVELERKIFKDNNIKCDTYFIYLDDFNSLPSHTFLTFEMNNKYYWFEHSWYQYKGIFEYNSINELLVDVKTKFVESKKEKVLNVLSFNVYLYKYDIPKFHINCNEFYDFIKTQELIDI